VFAAAQEALLERLAATTLAEIVAAGAADAREAAVV
jgi:hypothetical protein